MDSEEETSEWSLFENDRIEYEPTQDGKVDLYYVNAGWIWNGARVYIGTFDPLAPERLVENGGHFAAISRVHAEVSGVNTTDDWGKWFAKHAVDPDAPNYINIVHGNAHPDRFDRFAKAQNKVAEVATDYVTFVATVPLSATTSFSARVASYGPGRLAHTFDRHAAQWFGRKVESSTHLKAWADLIDRAQMSKVVFEWSTRGTPTIAHLTRIEGKWFVVQYFKDGANAGQLASAFVPTQKQVRAMFRVLFP